jgi:pimeloyl-ACP methyl ester carboxylesterase
MNPLDLKNAAWFDAQEYPFEPHQFTIGSHKMHYVDVGTGPVVLLVHGTPAWSFLYRRQIKALSAHFRCIAVDHIGFGLSDKPAEAPYSPAWHSDNLEKLVDHLQLREITLVVHDFGGPIGLSMAIRRPERIDRIVLLNTWLWETASSPAAQKVDRIIRSALGRFLYLRMNASPKLLLKSAFADKRKLTKAIHRYYIKVFPDKASRHGLLGLARNLVGASDWYGAQWQQIDRIAEKPCLIFWGMQDQFIGPDYLARWEGRLRNVRQIIRAEAAGHFVQEEAGDELSQAIAAFMASPQ